MDQLSGLTTDCVCGTRIISVTGDIRSKFPKVFTGLGNMGDEYAIKMSMLLAQRWGCTTKCSIPQGEGRTA